MELLTTRDLFGSDTTLSRLSIRWGVWGYARPPVGWTQDPTKVKLGEWLNYGFVCEDQDRGLDSSIPATLTRKVKKETAIPVGRYRLRRTWSPKFQKLVMEVQRVPAFQGIRVHPGKNDDWTEGCPLPGFTRDPSTWTIGKSPEAAKWLDERVAECETRGEECYWEVTRDPVAWAKALATLPHLADLPR